MAELIPLQPLYLQLLADVFAGEKMDTVILDLPTPGAHALYAVRKGTTVPELVVQLVFGPASLGIKLETRNQREHSSVVNYSEGLDGYLPELQRFLRADRLTDKCKAA